MKAATAAEVLEVLSRRTWYADHNKADCPADRIATLAALADWLPECPGPAVSAAGELIATLAGSGRWRWMPWRAPPNAPQTLAQVRDPATGEIIHTPNLLAFDDDAGSVGLASVMQIHRTWCSKADPRPLHPLSPIVKAWQRLAPLPVRAISDYGRPVIMPRQAAQVNQSADNYYLQRFNGAAHRGPGGQLLLGFEHPDMEGPTLPASIWTLALADAEKRAPGLPTALRIFLAAVVHVPLSARAVDNPLAPPVMLSGTDGRPWTLRAFLRAVYAGKRLPKPSEYWDVLWTAREVLHSVELDYEWSGRLWSRPVLRLDWPQSIDGGYETSMLDEPWPVSVHLPPGTGAGPPVQWNRLRRYMTRDAAAARALINLAYRWHIEGKRLVPVRKGEHWVQTRDPRRYDKISDGLAEQLCFPPGTGRAERRKRIEDARDALERLVKNGDAVAVDGRLLPPEAPKSGTR